MEKTKRKLIFQIERIEFKLKQNNKFVFNVHNNVFLYYYAFHFEINIFIKNFKWRI